MSTHSIDLLRIYRLVEQSCKRRSHGVSRQTITAFLADILLGKGTNCDRIELDAHRTFMRQIYVDGRTEKSGFRPRIVAASDAQINELYDFFDKNAIDNFNNLKEFRNHIYAPNFDAVRGFPDGSIDDREIQILENGRSVYRADLTAFPPVGDYVDVQVDRVLLLQHNPDGSETYAAEKHYIRISPQGRGQGAVILPVDEKTGRVMLVSQFRHPQRKWMSELPRGFADVEDRNATETAIRELEEETGLAPRKVHQKWLGDSGEIIELRSLYTDSGKLTESPAYFLAFVDAASINSNAVRLQPLMENPIWIDLRSFYQAVLTGRSRAGSTSVERIDFFAKHFKPKTKLDMIDPVLELEDAFTVNAANLAKPILMAKFPKIAKAIHSDETEWASQKLESIFVS